jgi:hypothetical protein
MMGVLASENDWSNLVDSSSDKIKIETKRSIRDLTMMRAEGPIDWSPRDVFRCLCYHPLRKEWDVNNEILEYKKKVGVNGYIAYIKTIRKFIISPRDFVCNYLINEEPDGTIVLCLSSENCDGGIGPISGIVRGNTALSGFVIKPLNGDPNKSMVQMMVEVDLKG